MSERELRIADVRFKFGLCCPSCLRPFDRNSVRPAVERIELACPRCHTVSAEIEIGDE